MLRLFLNGTIFWSADESEVTADHAIFSLKTTEEVNTIGTMTFTIGPTHPRLKELRIRWSTFLLADDSHILFIGRLTDLVQNFNLMIDCTVSDLMDALTCVSTNARHSTYEDTKVEHVDISQFVEENVIGLALYPLYVMPQKYSNGPSMTTDWKNFPIIKTGYIEDPLDINGDQIDMSEDFYYDPHDTVYDCLFNNYLSNSNAVIIITFEDGMINGNAYTGFQLYFNVISDITRLAIPTDTYASGLPYRDSFVFGDNLIEFSRETTESSKISGVFPFGSYTMNDGDHRKIIGSNNYLMSNVIWNEELFNKYGLKLEIDDFGDLEYVSGIGLTKNLDEMAEKYYFVKMSALGVDKFQVKAIDHYYLSNDYVIPTEPDTSDWDYDEDEDDAPVVAPMVDPVVSELPPIELREYYCIGRSTTDDMPVMIADPVLLSSEPHLVNVVLQCLSKEIDYFNHQNDGYVLGLYIPDSYLDPTIVKAAANNSGTTKKKK